MVDETNDPAAPSPSDPDDIRRIKHDIKTGEEWLKTGNYTTANFRERFWEENAEVLRCDWGGQQRRDNDQLTKFHVNIPYQNHRTTVPTLVWQMPHVTVDAKQPEFERDVATDEVTTDEAGQPSMKSDNFINARLFEILLNHEIQQMKLKDIIRRCVSHAKGTFGIGWAKAGYQDQSFSKFNNDRDHQRNYWIDWCDPRDVVFDFRAVEGKKRRWTAERCVMPRDEARARGFAIPDDYVGVLPEYILNREQNTAGSVDKSLWKDDPRAYVQFWEYNDHLENSIQWVMPDAGPEHFYIKEKSVDAYPYEGSSHVPLVIDPDDFDLIGITDIQPVYDQVKALNRMRTREVHHMDNYGTGVVMEEGAVAVEAKKDYDQTPYGWTLKVRTGKINAVKLIGTPSMGSDHYNMSGVHKEEIRTILRITDYQQGGGDLSRKATEAEIIRSAASLSIEDSRNVVGDFAIELVRRLAAMVQQFGKPVDFINVAKEEFDDDFVKVLKDQFGYNPKTPFLGIPKGRIQGEYDYGLNIEEMVHQPKEVRAAQIQRSLGVAMQDPAEWQKFKQKYDTDKIWEDLFSLNGVALKKYEKGGPVQIMAVIENEMFKQGMEVPEPHPKDNAMEHIIVHGPLRRELEQTVAELTAKHQKLTAGLQMIPEMMGTSPAGQTVQQTAQTQLTQIEAEVEKASIILRRLKLHVQAHESKEREEEMAMTGSAMPGMGGVAQPPQPEDIQALARSQQGGNF